MLENLDFIGGMRLKIQMLEMKKKGLSPSGDEKRIGRLDFFQKLTWGLGIYELGKEEIKKKTEARVELLKEVQESRGFEE